MPNTIGPERFLLFTKDDVFYIDQLTGQVKCADRYAVTLPDSPYFRCAVNDNTIKLFQEYGFAATKLGTVAITLASCVGMSWEECNSFLKQKGAKLTIARERIQKHEQTYKQLKQMFSGNILGIDKKFSYKTDNDFSICMQLRTMPYQEQVRFVRNNKNKILHFVIQYISSWPNLMKYVGSWGFWKVSDIIVTRSSEVKIIFSVKTRVIKALA